MQPISSLSVVKAKQIKEQNPKIGVDCMHGCESDMKVKERKKERKKERTYCFCLDFESV